MEYLSITGKTKLSGSVHLPSAKNSVLPILAASLLCEGEVIINGVPHLSDVDVSIEILQSLGCRAKLIHGSVHINAQGVEEHFIPRHLMGAMRSSIFYLAPLLARTGFAKVHSPGGCRLGARPIDIHLDGLQHMGAQINLHGDELVLSAPNGFTGTDYTLRLPSVGATETLMMAAAAARGNTVLRGVATEPEILDLSQFLISCGAKITGVGTNTIYVQGGTLLHGTEYTPFPDRITAATMLCAAAATGGYVRLSNCVPQHIDATLQILKRMGCEIGNANGALTLCAPTRVCGTGTLVTGAYPHFCTDAAPLMAAVLLTAKGNASITDTVFENRFTCANGFRAFGANAEQSGRDIIIKGVDKLHGASVIAPDLRGGAALVIAAMCAEGNSRVYGIEHLNRGYEDIGAIFASLGADIATVRGTNESIA
ncbi:MAG: UDP-N-acetylglucosamine 1-carboxyvinyltransferase [Oscillospiraceae bacterium]